MKWIKYILRLIAYYIFKVFIFSVCFVSKLGIGKSFCKEMKASHDFGAGSGEYNRGDFNKCYKILKPYLSYEDDFCYGGIKYQLGLLFFHGKGVTLNRETAISLFEEAATLGWEPAIQYLKDIKQN